MAAIGVREANLGACAVVANAPIDNLTSQFSSIQLHQPRQQRMLTNSHRSPNHPSEEFEMEVAAVQFVDLVRSTVSSEEEHYAFLELMMDHTRRSTSSAGDMNAINLDTLRQVNELFRNYPVLIAGFSANFGSISAFFGSILG